MFVDGAVIVGAPFEPFCDAIIVVRAPQQVLEQRIMRRDGISRQAAQARLASQLAQEKLDAAATFLLDNTGSEQALRPRPGRAGKPSKRGDEMSKRRKRFLLLALLAVCICVFLFFARVGGNYLARCLPAHLPDVCGILCG